MQRRLSAQHRDKVDISVQFNARQSLSVLTEMSMCYHQSVLNTILRTDYSVKQGNRTYQTPPQICIKYSLDGRRPVTTAEAFDAANWPPNCHQHKWLQVTISFQQQSKNIS